MLFIGEVQCAGVVESIVRGCVLRLLRMRGACLVVRC